MGQARNGSVWLCSIRNTFASTGLWVFRRLPFFFDAQGELLAIGQLAWPVSCRSIRSAFLAADGRDVCDCVERRSTAVATSRLAGPRVYNHSLCPDHSCVAVSDHGKISVSLSAHFSGGDGAGIQEAGITGDEKSAAARLVGKSFAGGRNLLNPDRLYRFLGMQLFVPGPPAAHGSGTRASQISRRKKRSVFVDSRPHSGRRKNCGVRRYSCFP